MMEESIPMSRALKKIQRYLFTRLVVILEQTYKLTLITFYYIEE